MSYERPESAHAFDRTCVPAARDLSASAAELRRRSVRSWSIRVLGAYLEQQFCTAAVDERAGWAHRTGRSRTQFESQRPRCAPPAGVTPKHSAAADLRNVGPTWAQRNWRERTRDGPITRQPRRFTLTTTPASRAADLGVKGSRVQISPDRQVNSLVGVDFGLSYPYRRITSDDHRDGHARGSALCGSGSRRRRPGSTATGPMVSGRAAVSAICTSFVQIG